jgi:hypothetical protein
MAIETMAIAGLSNLPSILQLRDPSRPRAHAMISTKKLTERRVLVVRPTSERIPSDINRARTHHFEKGDPIELRHTEGGVITMFLSD